MALVAAANGWSSRWNPMVWAGAGYALVTVDFHGSSGYSQEFTDSINRDWGGKPLEDLKLGLAAALLSRQMLLVKRQLRAVTATRRHLQRE